jgi:hypothetical protein
MIIKLGGVCKPAADVLCRLTLLQSTNRYGRDDKSRPATGNAPLVIVSPVGWANGFIVSHAERNLNFRQMVGELNRLPTLQRSDNVFIKLNDE